MAETEVYWWDMSGATMDHDRDSAMVLSMAYHWDMRSYTPLIHQGRSTKNPSKLDCLPTDSPLCCAPMGWIAPIAPTNFTAIYLLEMGTNNTSI